MVSGEEVATPTSYLEGVNKENTTRQSDDGHFLNTVPPSILAGENKTFRV